MTARELMKTDVGACAPDDELVTVLLLMRDRQCGWAPIVESGGMLAGVITDRDAAMAMLNHPNRGAARIAAADAMTRQVVGCAPNDSVRSVLSMMAAHHVRRLPVLSPTGHLQGVISIDDIVLAPQKRGMPDADVILEAMRAIVARPTVGGVAAR